MEKSFQDALLLRLEQNYGPSRFVTFMIKNINQWEDINFDQLLDIIDHFKYHGCTYALFPFLYNYLNIDIYAMYRVLANQHNWNSEKVKNQIYSFNTHILAAADKQDRLGTVKGSEKMLLEISNRLIREGALVRTEI